MSNYLIYGEDNLRKKEFVDQLKNSFKKNHSEINLETVYFDKDKISAQSLQSKLQAMPFLGKKRLLLLYNLFKNSSSKQTKIKVKQLSQVPKSTTVALIEDEPSKGLVNKLKKAGFSKKEFKQVYGYKLENWIKERAGDLGFSLTSEAIKKIIDYLGNDTGKIDQELIKAKSYLSYHSQKQLDLDKAEKIIAPFPKVIIFDLLDKVAERNKNQALKHLEDMISQGVSEIYILSMLEKTISDLIMAKDYSQSQSGVSAKNLTKKFGWHPYVAKKIYRQINGFNKKSLVHIYQRLLKLDYLIKTGKSNPRLQLTTFISQL